MRRPHSCRIQHSRRVLCHQFHPVRPTRHLASPHPPIVEIDRPVALAQKRQHPKPHIMGETQPHNQQHRRPASLLGPINLRPLVFNVRHAVKTPSTQPKIVEYLTSLPIIINRLQILSQFRLLFTQFFPSAPTFLLASHVPCPDRSFPTVIGTLTDLETPTRLCVARTLVSAAPRLVSALFHERRQFRYPAIIPSGRLAFSFNPSNPTPTYMVHSSKQPQNPVCFLLYSSTRAVYYKTTPREFHEGMVSPFAET